MEAQEKSELVATCNAAIAAGKPLDKAVDFYSKGCAGLVITVDHGRIVKDEGKGERRAGEVFAEFHYAGAVKNSEGKTIRYGIHTTKNPKTVLTLLLRMEDKDDVIDGQQYYELTTPREVLIQEARNRTLSAENELSTWIDKAKQTERENEELKRRLQTLAAKPGNKASAQQAEDSK